VSRFRNSYRKWKSRFLLALLTLGALAAVFPLVMILLHLVREGWGALNLAFFTEIQKPVGELGGGMVHSIVGTLGLVGLASLIGIPLGLASGVYLSESSERLAGWVRFSLELLSSTPSILIGVFVYGLVVVPMKRFSLLAGAIALAIILIPLVARTSEELLRLVPGSLREAGLALGIPRWKVILHIVLGSARPAVLASLVLAVARIAGETAPLVFTSFGSPSLVKGIDQPTSALPLQIYTYAISPFEEWHRMAWAGALLLVGFVLILNAVMRGVNRGGGSTHE
jgi:phosphate transport system permease protein